MTDHDQTISRSDVGAPVLPALIALFEVTISPTSKLHFVSSDISAGSLQFAGQTYLAYPVGAKGFAWSADGPPARPTLEMANINGLFDRAALDQSLLGCKVRRILTLANELEPPHGLGGGTCFPPEQWVVDRIARLDKKIIRLELSAEASLENRNFPHRLMLRDLCQHTYRRWDKAMVYKGATCPYVGNNYFDIAGEATTDPSKDRCSLALDSGCKKRFPTGPLPFLAFPGVTRL